ncbi:MAG: hypothetical protein A2V65_11165 [Deltaproteobacteria bacterium RBG_13_49_15]|nr:MAG: hypothetical protein A2V65_11165 [Deltaproteobacteria bacterium RBG_13_49_15]
MEVNLTHWRFREELSLASRLRRSYYEILRDDLDQLMMHQALIESYTNFVAQNIPYPFVEHRELKPRGRVPDVEYGCQNAFLVLFMEDALPSDHKKYIRFFDDNKTTKTNLLQSEALPLSGGFDRTQKYLESAHFINFLKLLLPMDYALLIQRDSSSRGKNRYLLSHFHVRIDWPVTDAAEDMALRLRYISKDIYEKGDKYAEDVQKKFFEYYSFPVMVGGRRTAAAVVSQYMIRFPCITTVYAGSCESRALIRISERGVSKTVLIRLTEKESEQLCSQNRISLNSFRKNYIIASEAEGLVFLFQTCYTHTSHARSAEDGKLREIKPELNWIRVDSQHILPKPGIWKHPPLPLNVIYSKILGPSEEEGAALFLEGT